MASENSATSYTLEVPDLESLPALPLNNVRGMPLDPVVYFVRGADRRVVYVGSTDCLAQRYAGHHRLAQFQALEQGEIAWMIVRDKAYRLAFEAFCIAVFHPALNNTPVPIRLNRWGETCKLFVIRLPESLYSGLIARKSRHDSLQTYVFQILKGSLEPEPLPSSPPQKAPGRKRGQPDVNQLPLFE